jgi:hypothetical protein
MNKDDYFTTVEFVEYRREQRISEELSGVAGQQSNAVELEHVDSPVTILTPGWHFNATGTALLQRSSDFNQGFAGMGGIHPFNDRFGVRADLVLSAASVVLTESNVLPGVTGKFTALGVGGRAHSTFYYKLTDNLVASFGATAVGIASRASSYSYVGVYTNLGYNIRF